MAKDTKFRREVAERIGPGFDLPKFETVEVVPSVPSSHEMEIVVSFGKIGRSFGSPCSILIRNPSVSSQQSNFTRIRRS
jgi:hypothetical protein